MNVAVTPAIPPAQEITLKLTVEEFAMLEGLRWCHVSGFSDLRGALDKGFEKAVDELHPHWADLVRQARDAGRSSCNSETVTRIFLAAAPTR